MGDLVWVRIFSPKPLVIAFISRHTTVQDFFSSFIRHERYFFQCRNQSAGYFCLKSPFPPPPPSKVKWSAPINITLFFIEQAKLCDP